MKIIGVVVGIIVVIAIGLGLYQAGKMFDLQNTFGINKSQQIEQQLQETQKKADSIINSGKQFIGSGAQKIIASGEALLQQKKLEAQQYILQQKEQLKAEAQKKLEEEAKKKIQGAFSGR